MPILPVSALPYIPSVFSPGDRLTYAGEFHTRDDEGRWMCGKPGCPPVSDSDMRRLYTDPTFLATAGLPLIAPRAVPDGEPLPGRPVEAGECPFEADRPYLMSGNPLFPFRAIVAMEPGPWGLTQGATTFEGPVCQGWYETTLTATGTVWIRVPSSSGVRQVTSAFVPAELPSGEDVVNLLSVAVLRAAFRADHYAPRVSHSAF